MPGQLPVVAAQNAVIGKRLLWERVRRKIGHAQCFGADDTEQKAEKRRCQPYRPGKPCQQHRADAQKGGGLIQSRGDKDRNGRNTSHKDDRGAHKPGGNGGVSDDERRHQTDRVPQRLRHPQPRLPDDL